MSSLPDSVYTSHPTTATTGVPDGVPPSYGTLFMFIVFIVFILLAYLFRGKFRGNKEINTLNNDITHFCIEARLIRAKVKVFTEIPQKNRTYDQLTKLVELPAMAKAIHCDTERVRYLREKLVIHLKATYEFYKLGYSEGLTENFMKTSSDLDNAFDSIVSDVRLSGVELDNPSITNSDMGVP